MTLIELGWLCLFGALPGAVIGAWWSHVHGGGWLDGAAGGGGIGCCAGPVLFVSVILTVSKIRGAGVANQRSKDADGSSPRDAPRHH